ncbi:ComF family protein [Helicobacter cynogastricus]|uniref:ComF family protein n=1 Tax=Helicobacter cynogastricus TaxID=329937 RepID=UPI000CF1B368|nr:phosphoribosyltransferase family protein [Helicobacter cynogastricus]
MRCLLCERWIAPFTLVCARCDRHLEPQMMVRTLADVPIYGFYIYDEIEILLKSKYYDIGSRLLNILARKVGQVFKEEKRYSWQFPASLQGIAIDDRVKKAYAHSAVILRRFCQENKWPALYNQLRATRNITYAGKSHDFRQSHPKDFIFKGKMGDYFLVDDILTTGSTMQQAIKTLKKAGARVHFGVVLALTAH